MFPKAWSLITSLCLSENKQGDPLQDAPKWFTKQKSKVI